MQISNKIFYVFGGASGLGEATARLLHSKGAYVAILDLNDTLAESVACSLNSSEEAKKVSSGSGPVKRALYAKVDICETSDILAAFGVCDEQWPGVTVGGAVVASAIGMIGKTLERDGTPHDLEVFETVMRVNTTGTFNVCRLVAARLVRDAPKPIPKPTEDTPCRGVIVTVASQAGLEGQAGQLAYATSKAAVVGMTLPMARDLAWYSIRTCSICPSIFETPMSKGMPKRARQRTLLTSEYPARFGRPDEFAHAATSIIENDMMNGMSLRLDGATRLAKL